MAITHETQQSATQIGPTFICYARDDEPFVTAVAAGLQARGIPVWLDRWNIQPGADWSRTIDAALDSSDTLLIVLSPDAVQSTEVLGELRVALDARKRILPVLYRRCAVPRQLQNLQYFDCTDAPDITPSALDHLARTLRRQHDRDAPLLTTDRERRIRQTVLDDVTSEAMDRLHRSVMTESPVPIRLERQPDQVDRSWDAEMPLSSIRRAEPIETDILKVFDDPMINGRLLVLGAPGSGKTTALLQLMRELADRASRDGAEPLPVLISLSSWRKHRSIGDWLVDELKIKYGVRKDHGTRWRDERMIAPLFDGLDELASELQEPCVDAINDFLSGFRPPHVVVCCRQAEYENLPSKLQLGGAIRLLPLDDSQIREYLHASRCAVLWSAIRDDPEWIEMARSPLLLSLMSALHDETHGQGWHDSASNTDRRQRLFDAYLSTFSSRRGNEPYSREQTLRWLRRLAATLKRNAHSEFLIERIQADWLASATQRWSYRAGVLMVTAAVVGVVMQSVLWLSDVIPPGAISTALRTRMMQSGRPAINFAILLTVSLAIGAVIATRRTIVPVETLTWSWTRAQQNMVRWLRSGLTGGLKYGSYAGIAGGLVWYVWQFDPAGAHGFWARGGLYVGAAFGVLTAAALALVKPGPVFREHGDPTVRRFVDALIGAIAHVIVIGFTLVWVAGVLSGLVMFLLLGFSAASTKRFRDTILRAMAAGTLSGAIAGALSGPLAVPSVPFWEWWNVFVSGGLTIGTVVGLAIGFSRWIGNRPPQTDAAASTHRFRRDWARTALAGIATGLAIGLFAVALVRIGFEPALKSAAVAVVYMRIGFNLPVVLTLMAMLAAATTGAVTAAVLGALGGALGGATGLDVERRLVPNQGIRQSAVNIAVFAGLGVLVIGVPYGIFNVLVGAITVRVLPSPEDWLRLGLVSGLVFGLLAGLLPGAACIQHFVLRVVLWASGALPLRCARFLNFATERRLLQRVGGRYRFIHELLRDHLARPGHADSPA